jgi:hypothetical protein
MEDVRFYNMQSFRGPPVVWIWGEDPRGPPDFRERNTDARATTYLRTYLREPRWTLCSKLELLAIVCMLPSSPFYIVGLVAVRSSLNDEAEVAD